MKPYRLLHRERALKRFIVDIVEGDTKVWREALRCSLSKRRKSFRHPNSSNFLHPSSLSFIFNPPPSNSINETFHTIFDTLVYQTLNKSVRSTPRFSLSPRTQTETFPIERWNIFRAARRKVRKAIRQFSSWKLQTKNNTESSGSWRTEEAQGKLFPPTLEKLQTKTKNSILCLPTHSLTFPISIEI